MIISANKGGLSNRLKSWVSAIKLANEKKQKYGVYWPILDSYQKNTHLLNCKFEDLFNDRYQVQIESCFNIDNINDNDSIYKSHCFYVSETDDIPNGFNTFESNCQKQFTKTNKNNRDIDFMYNQITEKVKKEYISYFNLITLKSELYEKVETFSNNFCENTVSVHIRSWNRNGELGRRSYLFQIDKFEKQMVNKLNSNSNTNFFLTSDSSQVINHFKKLNEKSDSCFYNKIIIYPRTTTLDNSRDFPEGIQEDLIELYLLSKNKSIIGSHFSTYTEVSWWLAGCPEDITIL